MKAVAVINSRAGSVGPEGAKRLRAALQREGVHHAECIELDPENSAAQFTGIADSNPDLVIVWGGDGTHRSALDALRQSSGDVLLLPGGTMNMLTRWLHAGRPWEQVLHAVLQSPAQRMLSGGQVDDRLFFCAFMAGVPARLADAREDLRRGDIARAFQDTGAAVESIRSIHLATSFGSDVMHADGHFPTGNVVGAMVGPLSRNGRMTVTRMELGSAWAALEFAWTSFVSDWRHQPGALIEEADAIIVENVDGLEVPAMIDGEKISSGARLEVTFVPEAATCLVAAS